MERVEPLVEPAPAVADYPMGWGNTRPSSSWFKLGFPSGYVTDVLQNLEVLCELGYGHDPRLRRTIGWLLAKQDADGHWRNEYAYRGTTWVDFERQGQPSKWVTLRACRVLRQANVTLEAERAPSSARARHALGAHHATQYRPSHRANAAIRG